MLYTTVLHAVRKQMDLSCNEYCIADIIYKLSNNPRAPVRGWCNQPREKMADEMGLSKRTVIDIINKLIEKGLVEKSEINYVRTTQLWYDTTIAAQEEIKSRKATHAETAPPMQKLHTETIKEGAETAQGGAESSPLPRAETAPYNKSIDNKSNNQQHNEVEKSVAVDALSFASMKINEVREEVRGGRKLMESDCMNLRIRPDYYIKLLDAFFDEQIALAEAGKRVSYEGLLLHFRNWLRTQVARGQESVYHPNYRGVAVTPTGNRGGNLNSPIAAVGAVYNELN